MPIALSLSDCLGPKKEASILVRVAKLLRLSIYHQGNISKMPEFDVFSLLDIRRHNTRSRGKRKNGNLKRKHKNKTFWTLTDLWKILKSGRHQMLLKLSSLSIASLRKLDKEAYKFYDRKHDLYQTALLTRCYTQHALRSYIDSEMNHILGKKVMDHRL